MESSKKIDNDSITSSQNEEKDNSQSKINWSHLSDIESLISEYKQTKKIRCMVFDTETTGLNSKKDHIIELAGVEMENFKLTGRNFHIYIKPRVYLPKQVTEVNHITHDYFKKFCEFYYLDTKIQLEKFLEFIGNDCYLIAHNAPFDFRFLNNELKYWGLKQIPPEKFRCTLRMMKKYYIENGIKAENHKLITCCNYFGIPISENDGSFHNALFDTLMTSKLFVHLFQVYNGENQAVGNKKQNEKYYKEKNNYEDKIKDNLKNNNNDVEKNVQENQIKEGNNDYTNEKDLENFGKLNGVNINLLIKQIDNLKIKDDK